MDRRTRAFRVMKIKLSGKNEAVNIKIAGMIIVYKSHEAYVS